MCASLLDVCTARNFDFRDFEAQETSHQTNATTIAPSPNPCPKPAERKFEKPFEWPTNSPDMNVIENAWPFSPSEFIKCPGERYRKLVRCFEELESERYLMPSLNPKHYWGSENA